LSLPLSLAVYFTLWWVVLFAMLPIGVRNADETPDDRPAGADKGAPVKPMMAKKVVATTLVAAALFALIDAYVIWSS
jgi:predicted secreted protein